MPQLIQLEQIPNQAFNITLGENNYDLRVYSIDGAMAYDVAINGVTLVQGFRFAVSVLMLPYPYQEINGNLILSVLPDELPDYTRFGDSQFLYYLTAEETAEYRIAFDAGVDL